MTELIGRSWKRSEYLLDLTPIRGFIMNIITSSKLHVCWNGDVLEGFSHLKA